MRGRTPMPDAWKQMAGNPGRRPIESGASSVVVDRGIPPCPDHLDERARNEWDRITPLLLTAGLLSTVDMAALAMYCVAYSRWVLAEERIKFLAVMDPARDGLTSQTTNGFEQLSHWYVISNKAQETLKSCLAEFGLSPAARARVKAVMAGGQGSLFGNDDPLAAFAAAAPKRTA